MAAPSLPARLSYLVPVLLEFTALGPDGLHEDTDTTNLEAALRERVAGVKPAKARSLLEGDRQALEKWLARPGNEESPGHFILAWLSGAQLADWLQGEPPADLPPPGKIAITAPPGLQMQYEREVLTAKAGPVIAIFSLFDAASHQLLLLQLRSTPRSLGPMQIETTTQEVRYGEVMGEKILLVVRKPVSWKSVKYLLSAPGGHVMVTVDGGGKDFDESIIESSLSSLRIE